MHNNYNSYNKIITIIKSKLVIIIKKIYNKKVLKIMITNTIINKIKHNKLDLNNIQL